MMLATTHDILGRMETGNIILLLIGRTKYLEYFIPVIESPRVRSLLQNGNSISRTTFSHVHRTFTRRRRLTARFTCGHHSTILISAPWLTFLPASEDKANQVVYSQFMKTVGGGEKMY
ncbi:hypothetical protein AKJ16_DCAP26148 [Drosera capensis]